MANKQVNGTREYKRPIICGVLAIFCTSMRTQAMLQPFYEKLSPEDRLLLQEAIRTKDRQHKPFFDAVTQGDQAVVEQQIATGTNLQYIDEFGRNALSHARTAPMFAYLLKNKVRLVVPQMADVVPEEERVQIAALKKELVRPLIQAIESGNIRNVESELKKGVVDIATLDTVLDEAIERPLLSYAKTASMQQFLMRHGAYDRRHADRADQLADGDGGQLIDLKKEQGNKEWGIAAGTAGREIEELLCRSIAQAGDGEPCAAEKKAGARKPSLSVPQYIAQLDTPHCSAILTRVLQAYLPVAPDGEPLESKKEE